MIQTFNESKGLGPGEWKTGKGCIFCPYQTGLPVRYDFIFLQKTVHFALIFNLCGINRLSTLDNQADSTVALSAEPSEGIQPDPIDLPGVLQQALLDMHQLYAPQN